MQILMLGLLVPIVQKTDVAIPSVCSLGIHVAIESFVIEDAPTDSWEEFLREYPFTRCSGSGDIVNVEFVKSLSEEYRDGGKYFRIDVKRRTVLERYP